MNPAAIDDLEDEDLYPSSDGKPIFEITSRKTDQRTYVLQEPPRVCRDLAR